MVFVDGGTSFTTDTPADGHGSRKYLCVECGGREGDCLSAGLGHDWRRADGTMTTCARCGAVGMPR